MAIGGMSAGELCTRLHMYITSSDFGEELVGSDLPQGLCLAGAAQLATGEVMVVGEGIVLRKVQLLRTFHWYLFLVHITTIV